MNADQNHFSAGRMNKGEPGQSPEIENHLSPDAKEVSHKAVFVSEQWIALADTGSVICSRFCAI